MRARLVVATAGAALGAACVDLFHATDFETLCDRDPAACGAVIDAGPDVAADVTPAPEVDTLCAANSAAARKQSERACALVTTCAGAGSGGAFARCLLQALAAYDCRFNPSLRPRTSVREHWSCLANVESCDDVERCLRGAARPSCIDAGAGPACSTPPTSSVECDGDGGRIAETPCVGEGRSCAESGACAGRLGAECAGAWRCEGTAAVVCEGSRDVGRDCDTVGSGSCVAASGDAGPACAPIATAAACSDDSGRVVCGADDVARACVGGREVVVDCAAIGRPCREGVTVREAHDACGVDESRVCFSDCPNADLLRSCDEGQAFEVSCRSLGLGFCRQGSRGPACALP